MTGDLDNLAARFAARTIPHSEWTHAAHLCVGAWHVDRYGPAEALTRLRTGIRSLNDSHGTKNLPTSGYHETVTHACIVLLTGYLKTCPPEMPLQDRVARLLGSALADRNVLLRFYSRETLMSPHARAEWIEPDLRPLTVEALRF